MNVRHGSENRLCRSGSLYSVSKLLYCTENYSSTPSFFFSLNVTTFTPHIPEKPPGEESELCFAAGRIKPLPLLGQVLPLLLLLGGQRVYKEPVEPPLVEMNRTERNLAYTFGLEPTRAVNWENAQTKPISTSRKSALESLRDNTSGHKIKTLEITDDCTASPPHKENVNFNLYLIWRRLDLFYCAWL